MRTVLLDTPIHPEAMAMLDAQVQVLREFKATLPELKEAIGRADAAIVSVRFPVTREVIESSSRVVVVGRPGAGIDSVDVRAATEAGVLVVYTPDGPTESVVEHALGFMLMLAKGLRQADAASRSGDWGYRLRAKGTELMGKSLGIIGGGHIGSRLAQVCQAAFDMKVSVYDPYLTADKARACGMYPCATLPELMAASDFVSIHTPLTSETRRLVGAAELAAMKPSAYLINTSRGPVVDEPALIEVLRAGRIAGAGLDVYEQEPPATDSPLLAMPNVVLSPHMASFTEEGRYRMGIGVAKQVLQVLRGERPEFLANPQIWSNRRNLPKGE